MNTGSEYLHKTVPMSMKEYEIADWRRRAACLPVAELMPVLKKQQKNNVRIVNLRKFGNFLSLFS